MGPPKKKKRRAETWIMGRVHTCPKLRDKPIDEGVLYINTAVFTQTHIGKAYQGECIVPSLLAEA